MRSMIYVPSMHNCKRNLGTTNDLMRIIFSNEKEDTKMLDNV